MNRAAGRRHRSSGGFRDTHYWSPKELLDFPLREQKTQRHIHTRFTAHRVPESGQPLAFVRVRVEWSAAQSRRLRWSGAVLRVASATVTCSCNVVSNDASDLPS